MTDIPVIFVPATLTLTVLDVNDNAPEFTESSYEFEVLEDEAVDSFISTISATDEDEGSNGEVTYELRGDDANLLKISSDTGEFYSCLVSITNQNRFSYC